MVLTSVIAHAELVVA